MIEPPPYLFNDKVRLVQINWNCHIYDSKYFPLDVMITSQRNPIGYRDCVIIEASAIDCDFAL